MNTIASQVYPQMAQIGHALGDPTRLRMMNLLMQTERSVHELSEMIGHSAPNTSAHLKVLQAANLVRKRRESRRVFYTIASRSALAVWLAVRDMGLEQSATVREAMRTIPDHDTVIRRMDAAALLDGVESGELTLLDLRPEKEYASGHLPASRSIPAAELEDRIDELDPQTTIIAYCRGPFCYAAIHSIEMLQARGFHAVRLYGGTADWIQEGLTLATDDTEHAASAGNKQ